METESLPTFQAHTSLIILPQVPCNHSLIALPFSQNLSFRHPSPPP
ncbi:unnamed protein product [Brassica napus]|uniref:(rape) hypothetical protein n=1 Tax=Brassica napus TaxID=3708 RepID=A0A817AMT4_BRANA|nr:unnamed protein product [Brassica napus]